MNNWNEIRSNFENGEELDIERLKSSPKDMFLYMKKLNGFDLMSDRISYEAFMAQHERLSKRLCAKKPCESVFEVGCGSGGSLYLFSQKGFIVGGIDYSQNLLDFAHIVIESDKVAELICDEMANTDTRVKYDGVFSNSVFSYFSDFEYAERVLEKMCEKCENSIVILDVQDFEKKEAFIDFRRSRTEHYDERYDRLPKLFYPKSFFEDFGKKHKLEVDFYESQLEGYSGNPYVYNVCLYK